MFPRLLTLPIWLAALAVSPVFAQGQPSGLAKATFAAGCFWCTEEAMDKVPGVISTTSGYMGGSKKNPTYEQVSTGTTGHTEVLQVVYDPKKVSYERLLEQFWVNHDPTVIDRQFSRSVRNTGLRSSGTTRSRSALPKPRRRSGRRPSPSSSRS